MNESLARDVESILHSQGLVISLDWIIGGYYYLQTKGPISNRDKNDIADKIFRLFLDSDIYEATATLTKGILDENINDINKENDILTPSNVILQIEDFVNVALSYEQRNNSNNDGKRLHKFFLTDGKVKVIGIEVIPFTMNTDLHIGSKISIHNADIRRGIIILKPWCAKILGGSVSKLINANEVITNDNINTNHDISRNVIIEQVAETIFPLLPVHNNNTNNYDTNTNTNTDTNTNTYTNNRYHNNNNHNNHGNLNNNSRRNLHIEMKMIENEDTIIQPKLSNNRNHKDNDKSITYIDDDDDGDYNNNKNKNNNFKNKNEKSNDMDKRNEKIELVSHRNNSLEISNITHDNNSNVDNFLYGNNDYFDHNEENFHQANDEEKLYDNDDSQPYNSNNNNNNNNNNNDNNNCNEHSFIDNSLIKSKLYLKQPINTSDGTVEIMDLNDNNDELNIDVYEEDVMDIYEEDILLPTPPFHNDNNFVTMSYDASHKENIPLKKVSDILSLYENPNNQHKIYLINGILNAVTRFKCNDNFDVDVHFDDGSGANCIMKVSSEFSSIILGLTPNEFKKGKEKMKKVDYKNYKNGLLSKFQRIQGYVIVRLLNTDPSIILEIFRQADATEIHDSIKDFL